MHSSNWWLVGYVQMCLYIYIYTYLCVYRYPNYFFPFPLPWYNHRGWQGVRSQFPFLLCVYNLRGGGGGGGGGDGCGRAFLCCTCSLMWFKFLSGFICVCFLKPGDCIFTSVLYYSFSGTCGGWQSVVAFCTYNSLLCASACVCGLCLCVFVLFVCMHHFLSVFLSPCLHVCVVSVCICPFCVYASFSLCIFVSMSV